MRRPARFQRAFTLIELLVAMAIFSFLATAMYTGIRQIVLEREVTLQPFIDRGVRLDAAVRAELLDTIFSTPTLLHDGAAILHGNRLIAAACILPLSRNEHLGHTVRLPLQNGACGADGSAGMYRKQSSAGF